MFRRSGGWAFRIDVGYQPTTGNRRQMLRQGFTSKRDAEKAMQQALTDLSKSTVVTRSTLQLKEFLTEWLVLVEPKLRPSTHHSYKQAVERISTHLGRYQLQAITPMQIERFYVSQLNEGGKDGRKLSPKTVRNTHVVLRKALADAERLGYVQRNAAAAAHPPVPEKRDLVTWSTDDLSEFLEAIDGDPLEIAYHLLAATGMRRGEVLGLRWRDVDFDLGQIAVAHTITTAGRQVVMGPPKTPRSKRNVYLDKRTVALLRRHRKRQREQRLAAGAAWHDDLDLVIRNEIGQFIHPDVFTARFDAFVRKLDVPRIRLHDLRHTHATLALKAGVHPKIVSERLGHATVGVTLDLYSHVMPALARDAAEQIMSGAYRAGAEVDDD